MNSGAFNELDDRIVNVTYITAADLQPDRSENLVQGEDTGRIVTAIPVYAWALIGLASILFTLILVLAFLVSRRFVSTDRAGYQTASQYEEHEDNDML